MQARRGSRQHRNGGCEVANKGYCAIADIAGLLGITLTAAQQTEATSLIGSTEVYIDRETNFGWLIPPITAEQYDLHKPYVYLRRAPVTSVQTVQTRTNAVGDVPVTLTANVDYELLDANLGLVTFVSGYWGKFSEALISYTPNLPVPADITYATTLIVANSLTYTILPDSFGIAQARFGRLTGLTFRESGAVLTVPVAAREILDAYRKRIIV